MFRKLLTLAISLFAMLFWGTLSSNAQTSKRFAIKDFLEEKESGQQKPGNRWALIIGIDTYHDPEINPLNYAVNDAKALYELLVNSNRGKFPPEHVKLLTSDEKTNKRLQPTEANILYYLKSWLRDNVKKEDTVLIFFSGHGAVQEGRTYLLPVDTDTFYMPAYAIDNNEFVDGINQLKAEKIITLLDSCHSGGVAPTKGMGDMLPDDFYAKFEAATGNVTLSSCRGNEQSWEWPEKGHGVFTYYLLEGLKGEANTQRDQAVTFDEVAEYVGAQVSKWVKDHKNESQNPTVHIAGKSASSQIALTFDLVAGFEAVKEKMRDKIYKYVGTGENNLTVRQAADAEELLDYVASKMVQEEELPVPVVDAVTSAMKVLKNLVEESLSVTQYKSFGITLVESALKEIRDREKGVERVPAQYGQIKVYAEPWANVFLDQKSVGVTPLPLKDVVAGKHQLTLKHTDFEVSKEINVIPNQTIVVTKKMGKPIEVTVE
jgi:hypothetical protein